MADEYDTLMRELKLLEAEAPNAEVHSDRSAIPTSWDEDSIAAAFARDEPRQKKVPR